MNLRKKKFIFYIYTVHDIMNNIFISYIHVHVKLTSIYTLFMLCEGSCYGNLQSGAIMANGHNILTNTSTMKIFGYNLHTLENSRV